VKATDDHDTTPAATRQQLLTAAMRCYYANGATNIERPRCQGLAVVAYGPIALCDMCDKMRSAVGRTHPPRRLPGAEIAVLIDAARTLAQAQADLDIAVRRARTAGASWNQIGDAVGLSRQGAQQRWAHLPDRSEMSTPVDAITQPDGKEVNATS
jgi:hypothetical protein